MSENYKFKNDNYFEECVVQALISDYQFAEQMTEVLDLNYFNLEYLREITKFMLDYYKNHAVFPSYKLLVSATNDVQSDTLKQEMLGFLAKIKSSKNDNDMIYVKEQALEFCRKRALVIALEGSLDLIENNKYEQIVGQVQKAINAGAERDIGHLYDVDFEKRMQTVKRTPITTPWEEINKITGGGLAGGELGVICAPTGVGKSHAVVDIGNHAASIGKNVVHYSFELTETVIGNRYDARLTGIAPEFIFENKETIKSLVGQVPGKIIIKTYPTASVMTIKSHLSKLRMRGIKVDMIIVDYADLMRSQYNYDQRRLEEEAVYKELRELALELNLPIWTPTQTNREGMDAEVVTLKHVSEAFGKAKIADLFITMNRKKENKPITYGNVFVAKNRLGPDGIKFPAMFNTSLSKIQVLSPESFVEEDDSEASNLERLKQRFKEFKNNYEEH